MHSTATESGQFAGAGYAVLDEVAGGNLGAPLDAGVDRDQRVGDRHAFADLGAAAGGTP